MESMHLNSACACVMRWPADDSSAASAVQQHCGGNLQNNALMYSRRSVDIIRQSYRMKHHDHWRQLLQRKQIAQKLLQKHSKHPQQSDHDERNQPQHHLDVQQQLHPLELKTSTNGRRPAAAADCRCLMPSAAADSELLRQAEHDGTQQQVVVCTIRHRSAAFHHHATLAPHKPPCI